MANKWDLNGSINPSLRETVKTSTPGPRAGKIPQGRIWVNQIWRQSQLLECLAKHHCQLIFSSDSDSIIDFCVAEKVAVVYLSEAECILNTTYNYRRKLAKLRNNKELRGVVLFEKTEMTKQYLQPLQKFAVVDLGLVLLTVANQAEAAQLLVQINGIENNERSNAFRIKKCMPSFDDIIPQTLLQIPGLGETKAKQLISHYKSITNIGAAGKEDLVAVIGKSAANQVWNFFR